MAPKWLAFSDETGKRSSVMPPLISSNRDASSNTSPSYSPRPGSAFDSSPELDKHRFLKESRDGATSLSHKRRSIFTRSGVSSAHSSLHSRWSPLQSHDEDSHEATQSCAEDGDTRRMSFFPRKRTSTLPSQHAHPASARLSRWIRGDEEARPSTVEGGLPRLTSPEASSRDLKSSISQPFNFQHVSHTQRDHLPKLESSDSEDLLLDFWASSAQHLPENDSASTRAVDDSAISDIHDTTSSSRPSLRSVASQPSVRSRFSHGMQSIQGSPAGSLRNGVEQGWSTPESSSSPALSKITSTQRPISSTRSSSYASLTSEPRTPPTAIHPAFRNQPVVATDLDFQLQRPYTPKENASVETGFLEVVLEENENISTRTSPLKARNTLFNSPPMYHDWSNAVEASEPPPLESSMASFASSDLHSSSASRQHHISLPSLCSGDSWEDDIDYCYENEAESTCHFVWDPKRASAAYSDLHDSTTMSSPRHDSTHDHIYHESPRTSIAHHQRGKSSMTLKSFADLAALLPERYQDPEMLTNPRPAPKIPLPTIPVAQTAASKPEPSPQWQLPEVLSSGSSLQLPAHKAHVRSKSVGGPVDEDELKRSSKRWTFHMPNRTSLALSGLQRPKSMYTMKPAPIIELHSPPAAAFTPPSPILVDVKRLSVPSRLPAKMQGARGPKLERMKSTPDFTQYKKSATFRVEQYPAWI